MSERVLILVALSLIIAMVAGTTIQLRRPQFAPPLVVDTMRKASPPLKLADVSSVDAAGNAKPFNSRITRPTLVTFWATWCVPCLREMPTLAKFKPMAEAAGIDLITVNEDKEGLPVASKFLAEKGLSDLPLVVDADGKVAKALGVKGMPTALIVNARGEEVARMEGEADWGDKASLDIMITLLELGPAPAPAR
ncbi:MAG: TlpA family protein disulfide reductase [Magnetospirillum sp.]|nr:TlpA family protein disulfide reductase [Magnetospirillum sp.]